MCGIAGWVDFTRDLRERVPALDTMVATMARRGPDAEGSWVSPHALLGHRRLAVIDLPGGKQPMTVVRDGRLLAVITYSGEVYNFRELRSELVRRGHQLATASDTEVVLLSYVEWGESFVDRLNGMFAFAIWDVLREQLVLARDRMGVKPLYYHPTLGGVVFGSEPKAILANPLVDTAIDEDGLREILGFVKTPGHGIYQGMYEVHPGQLVRISRPTRSRGSRSRAGSSVTRPIRTPACSTSRCWPSSICPATSGTATGPRSARCHTSTGPTRPSSGCAVPRTST